MKRYFTASVALLAILMLAVTFGCSKKTTTPTEPTTPVVTTAAVPAAQQPAVAASTTPMVTGSVSNIEDVADGLASGTFKGGKTPPTGWTLNNGWYYANAGWEQLDTFKLKFTPDIWGGTAVPPYRRPGQIEYAGYGHHDDSSGGTTMHVKYIYSALGKYLNLDTLATIVEGNYGYVVTNAVTYGTTTFNLNYTWSVVFDNVSIVSNNHSKHFTYTCTWPYYGTTGVLQTSLNGEFKFDAQGYGNLGADGYAGFSATNGTTFVKYYYTANGRYYTLLSENWATHHSF